MEIYRSQNSREFCIPNIHIFYTLTFYAPIFCSSLFFFVYLAPRLSFTFFSFLNFDAPICLSYILPFLLSHRPSVLYYFAFLFVLCGAPSFTFVAVCLHLYIPIFAILALLSFLLQFLSNLFPFVTFFYFSFPFLPFYVPSSLFLSPFPFSFFSFPFPLPFSSFSPFLSFLFFSSSSFWRPLWSLFGAPLWPPGVQAHAMHPPRYATAFYSIFTTGFNVTRLAIIHGEAFEVQHEMNRF